MVGRRRREIHIHLVFFSLVRVEGARNGDAGRLWIRPDDDEMEKNDNSVGRE